MDTENVYDSLPVISSFSTAPFDILEEIFLACPTPLDELDGSLKLKTYFGSFTEPLPAWALAGVCQHWRDSALSIPALWPTVFVYGKTMGSGRRREGNLAFLSLLLDRSKNLPLTIHIDCDGDNEDVLNMLSPHISRARVLYFNLGENPESGLRNLLSGSTHLPFLRSLSALDHTYPEQQFSPISPAFHHAPLLERLYTKSYLYDAQWMHNIGIPWSQIRHFKSCRVKDIVDFFKSLLRMPNLIHLDIDNIVSFRLPSEPVPYTRLEHLTYIKLQYATSGGIWHHLPHLELPALTEIDLRGIPSLAPLWGLLERSNCASQICALTLRGTDSNDVKEEALKKIILMTPNLLSLNLLTTYGSLQEGQGLSLIRLFTSNPDAGHDGLPTRIILPKLTTLHIEQGNHIWPSGMKDFIDALVAREVLPAVKRASFCTRARGTTVYEISGVQEVKETYYPK